MSNVVFSSLKTAVKGTALLVVTIAVGQVLWLLIRILIVRNITQAELGIYSLALTVMSIVTIFSNLGLFEGATRYISVARGEGDTKKVNGTIKNALQIILITSSIATLVLYLLSDLLSIGVFDMPELSSPLMVIAISVIISAMIDIQIAILRGYGIIGVKAANAVANPIIYGVLLIFVFWLKLHFIAIIVSFVIANFLSMSGISIYTYKKLNLGGILFKKIKTYRRELMVFSLPLLGVALTGLVMTWTDTLMIGYFMKAEDVGLYSVGVSLSRLLMFAVNILSFVFMPIAGELYARGQMNDLKRTYQVLTKWTFMVTFPVFLVLFFFPEMTLTFLFGKQYEAAAMVLRILSLRFMMSLFVGSSGLLLTVFGMTRIIMWSALVGAIMNLVLNYILIQRYGLNGAAAATMISSLCPLVINFYSMFSYSKFHPFTTRYLKPVGALAIVAILIYAIAKSIPLYFWMLPIYLIIFIGGYVLSILLTRSIEKEDVSMFEAVTSKLGIELNFIKNVLLRFSEK